MDADVGDIARLRDELDTLRRSSERDKARFFNVVGKNLDGIIIVNRDGVITYINPSALDLFGRGIGDLLGEEFGIPVKGNYTTELTILNPARGELFAEMRVAEIEWGGARAYLASLRDITDRKRAEASLKEAKEALESWSRELEGRVEERTRELRQTMGELILAEKLSVAGVIAAGMAHELNNPLSGVLGIIRGHIREKEPGSEEHSDLVRVRDACELMATIIADFSGFTRPSDGGNLEIACNEVIESALTFAAFQLKKKNIRIERDLDPGLPKVFGNKNQLQQIVVNMVTNARDATPKDGIFRIATRTVDVEGQRCVEMEFTDNGHGIGRETVGKIFDPFFTTKRTEGGNGLGLSVVRRVVENHKGHISVESEPGKGTTFKVRLPAVAR